MLIWIFGLTLAALVGYSIFAMIAITTDEPPEW